MNRSFSLTLVLGFLSTVVAADSAYITDKVYAGLYPQPKSEGKPLQLLSGAAEIEILERGDVFHKVRLASGVEGWVNVAYLIDDKPSLVLLGEARSRIAALEEQLAAAQATQCAEEASATTEAGATKSAMAAAQPAADCDQVTSQLDALQGRVDQAAELLGTAPETTSTQVLKPDGRVRWYWYALPLSVLLGLLLGIVLMDYRLRRRFGGARI